MRPPRLGDAHHLLGHVERARREHRAENTHREIEAGGFELDELRGVAFLKPDIGKAQIAGAFGAGRDQVFRDIDAKHVGAALRGWNGGGAVAAAEV